nr:MAG TPA: hypothetical protein [Caudoviricetes sp.]
MESFTNFFPKFLSFVLLSPLQFLFRHLGQEVKVRGSHASDNFFNVVNVHVLLLSNPVATNIGDCEQLKGAPHKGRIISPVGFPSNLINDVNVHHKVHTGANQQEYQNRNFHFSSLLFLISILIVSHFCGFVKGFFRFVVINTQKPLNPNDEISKFFHIAPFDIAHQSSIHVRRSIAQDIHNPIIENCIHRSRIKIVECARVIILVTSLDNFFSSLLAHSIKNHGHISRIVSISHC